MKTKAMFLLLLTITILAGCSSTNSEANSKDVGVGTHESGLHSEPLPSSIETVVTPKPSADQTPDISAEPEIPSIPDETQEVTPKPVKTKEPGPTPVKSPETSPAPTTESTQVSTPRPVPEPAPVIAQQPTPEPSMIPAETEPPYVLYSRHYIIPVQDMGDYHINEEDNYVIEGDVVKIRLQKNTLIHDDILLLVEKVMADMEDETGLKFKESDEDFFWLLFSEYDNTQYYNNSNFPDFYLSISNSEGYYENGTLVNALINRLSYRLIMQNGYVHISANSGTAGRPKGEACDTFVESFSMLMKLRLSEKLGFPYSISFFDEYLDFPNEDKFMADSMKAFAETRGVDSRCIAYRFALFMHEKYDRDIYYDLIGSLSDKYGTGTVPNAYDIIDDLELMTTQLLFRRFDEWYSENRSRFQVAETTIVLQETDEYLVYPTGNFNRFGMISYGEIEYISELAEYRPMLIRNSGKICLDFSYGFGVMQQKDSLSCFGIAGEAVSDGAHKLYFYSVKDELVGYISLNGEAVEFDIRGAVRIEITGDGTPLIIRPDIQKMTNAEEKGFGLDE